MEALLDSIRIAVSDGASDDERHRGVAACRAVADALEGDLIAEMSSPLMPPDDAPVEVVAAELAPPSELTTVSPPTNPLSANPFAGLSADEILELAIAKLRGAVGDDGVPPPAGQPFRLTLVPVPRFS